MARSPCGVYFIDSLLHENDGCDTPLAHCLQQCMRSREPPRCSIIPQSRPISGPRMNLCSDVFEGRGGGDGKGARTRRLRLHSFIFSAGPPACPTDGTKPPPCLNPPEHLWANRGPLDFPSIYVQFDDVSGFLGLLLRCFAHVGEVSGSPWPTFKFMYRSTRSRCPLDTPANHVGVGETSGSPVDLPANLCANR